MAKILLVDDERDVVTLLQFLLERDGHEVSTAFNGEEALGRVGIDPEDLGSPLPDLIVLDVMMPIMDGRTVAQKLNEERRTRAIPVLLMTAKGGLREALSWSPNIVGGLAKPFDPAKFRDMIAEKLKLSKAAR